MPILFALPFCSKDQDLALWALKAGLKLDGYRQQRFDCILSYEPGLEITEIRELAKKYFKTVHELVQDKLPQNQPWPFHPNRAWQQTMRHVEMNWGNLYPAKYTGVFWWEPDAVPVRKAWMEIINEAHTKKRCPFSGFKVHDGNQWWMNGVGVWPVRISDFLPNCGAMWASNIPFDMLAGRELGRHKFNELNGVLVHYRKSKGGGQGLVFEDTKGLFKNNPDAVFFHGCTDGSLHQIIAEEHPKPPPKPPKKRARRKSGRWANQVADPEIRNQTREIRRIQIRQSKKWVPPVTIWHCVERHKTEDPEEKRRVQAAFDSWLTLYQDGLFKPAHYWHYRRSSKILGDSRGLPYLKDVLAEGLDRAEEDDIIVLTNDDTVLMPSVAKVVYEHLTRYPATSSFRSNFYPNQEVKLNGHPATDLKSDLGRDLFAFRVWWILDHWWDIPDFLLGELEWDLVLTTMIREVHKIKTDKENLSLHTKAEIPTGYVLHEKHDPRWYQENQRNNPAKLYNIQLMARFHKRNHTPHLITRFESCPETF